MNELDAGHRKGRIVFAATASGNQRIGLRDRKGGKHPYGNRRAFYNHTFTMDFDMTRMAPSTITSPSAPEISLHYYGGKILKTPSFISLYAGTYWKTSQGLQERSTLNACSQSVPTGRHASLWKEYGVSSGTFLGSADISIPANKRTVNEKNIQSMVASAITHAGIKKPDGETVYTIFLPPGVVLTHGTSDSRRGLGGFHGSYVDPSTAKPVYYSAIVYAGPGSGVPFTRNPVDNMTIAASHEWTEAVTNPDVNRDRLAWYNKTYGEVGDIPIALGLPLNTLWGRMQGCAVQKEWSNDQGAPALTNPSTS